MTFNEADNEEIPESLVLLWTERNNWEEVQHSSKIIIPRFNNVREELTLSAPDKRNTPESPIPQSKNKKQNREKTRGKNDNTSQT